MGGTPKWMVFVRDYPKIKWMMTGGTPIAMESPMYFFFPLHPYGCGIDLTQEPMIFTWHHMKLSLKVSMSMLRRFKPMFFGDWRENWYPSYVGALNEVITSEWSKSNETPLNLEVWPAIMTTYPRYSAITIPTYIEMFDLYGDTSQYYNFNSNDLYISRTLHQAINHLSHLFSNDLKAFQNSTLPPFSPYISNKVVPHS